MCCSNQYRAEFASGVPDRQPAAGVPLTVEQTSITRRPQPCDLRRSGARRGAITLMGVVSTGSAGYTHHTAVISGDQLISTGNNQAQEPVTISNAAPAAWRCLYAEDTA
jgi:hypothetical protein